MPEQIDNPDGDWVDADIIYQTAGYDMAASSLRVDGAANTHLASLWAHGNCTVVYYRKISPTGELLLKKNIVLRGTPHTLDPAMSGKPKTVDFDMAPSGADLVFSLGGHLADPTHSQNPVGLGRVVGAYVPVVGASPEDGRAGSFQPQDDGGGGGGGLTEAQMRAILRDELGLRNGENDLIGQFAGNAPVGQSTIRKGLHETGVGDTITALKQAFDPNNTSNDVLLFRFWFAGFVRDRAYEGARAALGHSDEIQPDEPTRAALKAHAQARAAAEA